MKIKYASLLALMVSSFSFATSVQSVALESVDAPLYRFGRQEKMTIIRIADDGTVYGGICENERTLRRPIFGQRGCDWQTMKKMPWREVARMQRLIERAEQGQIYVDNPLCLALPQRSIETTARNGQVLLTKGSYPCGRTEINRSPATQELLNIVKGLRGELLYGHVILH